MKLWSLPGKLYLFLLSLRVCLSCEIHLDYALPFELIQGDYSYPSTALLVETGLPYPRNGHIAPPINPYHASTWQQGPLNVSLKYEYFSKKVFINHPLSREKIWSFGNGNLGAHTVLSLLASPEVTISDANQCLRYGAAAAEAVVSQVDHQLQTGSQTRSRPASTSLGMAFTQKQRLKDAGLKAIQEAPEEEDWTKYWEQLDDLPDLHEPGILVNSQYLDQRHGLRTFSGISHPMLGVIGAMIAFLVSVSIVHILTSICIQLCLRKRHQHYNSGMFDSESYCDESSLMRGSANNS